MKSLNTSRDPTSRRFKIQAIGGSSFIPPTPARKNNLNRNQNRKHNQHTVNSDRSRSPFHFRSFGEINIQPSHQNNARNATTLRTPGERVLEGTRSCVYTWVASVHRRRLACQHTLPAKLIMHSLFCRYLEHHRRVAKGVSFLPTSSDEWSFSC